MTTDGGVVEDKPSTGSPGHCTSDEGRQIKISEQLSCKLLGAADVVWYSN